MKGKELLGREQKELEELMQRMGQRPFRGRQIYAQLYRRREAAIERMSDLSSDLRSSLAEHFRVGSLRCQERRVSRDGTTKFLFRLEDGRRIETVLIPEKRRQTVCLSSQVGCAVNCSFCMTARMGFERNLTAGEILEQLLFLMRDQDLAGGGLNVVFMGMGEPLYNYTNVMKAFRIMVDPRGLGFSPRRITLSTSGVVPLLNRLRREMLLPNLAVSLNASSDEQRNRLMPLNRKWNLETLLEACRNFPGEPRRRITFEYVLLAAVNDSDQDARRVGRLLAGMEAKVNLIPYNPNPGLSFRRPRPERVERFRQLLLEQSIDAFVRRPRGDEIAGACGQLAYLGEGARV